MLNDEDFLGGGVGCGGKGEDTCVSKLESYDNGYLLDEWILQLWFGVPRLQISPLLLCTST